MFRNYKLGFRNLNYMPLGRGLSSLIPSRKPSLPQVEEHQAGEGDFSKLLFIPPEFIDPNPYQPRDTFPHGSMEELIESIRRHGVLEPLLAVPKKNSRFELISGERRLRAAKALGLKTVPVIVRHAEDLEKLELSLIENLQREDLNPIEEAEGVRRFIDEFNLTQEEVAKRIGKSREVVANALRLLSLPGEMQEAIANRKISPAHGRLLLQVADSQARELLFEQILKNQLTLKEAELAAKDKLRRRSKITIKNLKIADYEESLREKLGTKVSIEKRGKQGKITIYFYSDEELDNIVGLIKTR